MQRTQFLAEQLLAWNKAHLTADSAISLSDIGRCFAPDFIVRANGREYQANHDNYLAFLQSFKADIAKLNYNVQQLICDNDHAVVVMTAQVLRVTGIEQQFTAMLLLGFDSNDRVNLWQEVYLELPLDNERPSTPMANAAK